MKRFKRVIAVLLMLFTVTGFLAVAEPYDVKAETKWYTTSLGKFNVQNADNDYKDGKYRFNFKITYEKTYTNNDCGLTFQNIYLTNSQGKTVTKWNKNYVFLKNGGTTTVHFSVDFSDLPSDKYTIHFTINDTNALFMDHLWNFKRTVTHNAQKLTYSSSKYTYDTNGNKSLKITFKTKDLKGYAPKFEVFDSNGKVVYSKNCSTKISSNDNTYTFEWNFNNKNGIKVKDGSYTFKLTANGKSASKQLNIKVK